MNRGKDGVEKFVEHIEDKVKWLYEAFPQLPVTHLTDMLNKNTKQQKNAISALKNLMNLRTER